MSFRVSLAACSPLTALTQGLIIASYLAIEPAVWQTSWSITNIEMAIVGLSEPRRLTGK